MISVLIPHGTIDKEKAMDLGCRILTAKLAGLDVDFVTGGAGESNYFGQC